MTDAGRIELYDVLMCFAVLLLALGAITVTLAPFAAGGAIIAAVWLAVR